MIIKDGFAIMEHVGFPGNIGDCMAETSRIAHIDQRLGYNDPKLNLLAFRTDKGYVRHPDSPWREDDMSGDQYLPWFLAVNNELRREMRWRLFKNFWRYGNGDLVHPQFTAIILNFKWLIDKTTLAQYKLFDLEWRWSDEHNRFESNKDSSADYLNFIHTASYASEKVRRQINPDKLMDKVGHYYFTEPNANFLYEMYDQFCDKFFRF